MCTETQKEAKEMKAFIMGLEKNKD